MKKLFYILNLICLTYVGNSQIETYQLQNYTQPDFYRMTSGLTPSFYLENNKDVFESEEVKYNGFIGSLNYFLNINKYDQNTQGDFQISTTPRYTYLKTEDYNDNSQSNFLSLSNSKKHFLTTQDFFWGYEISHFSSVSRSTRKVLNVNSFSSNSYQLGINTNNRITVKIGKGRIENVNLAFHAIQILNTICKHGKINPKEISHKQITGLADKLGDLLNIRNPDFRLEENEEIETLFTYLENENLIDKEDYHLIADVLDAYRFESFINRDKGSDWHVGVGGKFNYNKTDFERRDFFGVLTSDQKSQFTDIGPFIEAGYSFYRPISHQWQLNIENVLQAGFSEERDILETGVPLMPFRDESVDVNWLSFNSSVDLYFLLNRRTTLFLNYSSSVLSNNSTIGVVDSKEVVHNNNGSLGLTYYFNPWHTLTVNLGLFYSKGYRQSNTGIKQTIIGVQTNYYFH